MEESVPLQPDRYRSVAQSPGLGNEPAPSSRPRSSEVVQSRALVPREDDHAAADPAQARPLLIEDRPHPPETDPLACTHVDADPRVVETTAEPVTIWLPYMLRWYYLLVPALVSLCFCVITPCLLWRSRKYYGLGNNTGSSAIFFGWRFTPTLVAVLYTQLTAMLLDDVKRTEPLARMAKSAWSGASAATTILQGPTAWWAALADGFSKEKNGGRRSPALICSALINILAFLTISPLSSSLLSTQNMSVPEQMDFSTMVPRSESPIALSVGRDTYLRTTSNFLANTSSTDWITDSYVVLPFWPSSEEPRLGQNILDTPGSWQANTTVFSAELSCVDLSLVGMAMTRQAYSQNLYNCSGRRVPIEDCSEDPGPPVTTRLGYVPSLSAVFTSTDGCQYGVEVPLNTVYAYPSASGYVTWSPPLSLTDDGVSDFNYMLWVVGNETTTEVASDDFVWTNVSNRCISQEPFLLTTPWTTGFSDGTSTPVPTLDVANNITLNGFLCSQTHYMAKMPVTLSKASGTTQIVVAEDEFLTHRTVVPDTLLNATDVQSLSLHSNWSSVVGLDQVVQNDRILNTGGMGSVVSSLWNFNLTEMMDNPEVLTQATRLRTRFFNELVLNSISAPGAFEADRTLGLRFTDRKRVMVVEGVATALTILLGISFFLYVFLFFCTRHQHRPLNVRTDPATTVGLAMLFDPRYCTALPTLHRHQKDALKQSLRKQQYYTKPGRLCEAGAVVEGDQDARTSRAVTASRWEPPILRLSTLSALLALLAGLVAALVVMHQVAAHGVLHQTTFVYRLHTSTISTNWAPFSMVPTTIAVLTGLWWGAMDGALRSLEPYMAMSRSPKAMARGAGLSYVTAYWLWASAKAARRQGWGLACVTLGTTLSQILIVAFSALFEIESGVSTRSLELHRALEIRQIPIITNFYMFENTSSYNPDVTELVLQGLYTNASGNWIYGATNQLALNGTPPLWSLDEWSFVPLDLTQIPNGEPYQGYSNQSSDSSIPYSLRNATINTPAIRARLDCSPVDAVSNQSSWLALRNISHPAPWLVASGRPHTAYQTASTIWSGTPFNTSMLSAGVSARCCVNESSDVRRSALGHWSTTDSNAFPHTFVDWPFTFSAKWLLGNAQYFYDLGNLSQYTNDELSRDFDPTFQYDDVLFFTDEPSLQAVHCSPAIEIAEADVTVDTSNGRVLSYQILTDPEPSDSPWLDVLVLHTTRHCQDYLIGCGEYRENVIYPNVTTSYGVLFMDALLGASFHGSSFQTITDEESEQPNDEAYEFNDPRFGLNLDLMTYAVFCLAGRDPEALLNATTLANLTERVFETFFQHFASDRVSLSTGGWAYQTINASLPTDLPSPIDQNFNATTQRSYPVLNTKRTTVANISETIDVLRMSSTATWLSVSILVWLILTTVFIAVMQYLHGHLMIRNVDCIADVLVLIAGSENFLRLVEQRGPDLRHDPVCTRLGWFRKASGEVRYGIEVVGGANAVEWVDPPEDWVAAQEKTKKQWTSKRAGEKRF